MQPGSDAPARFFPPATAACPTFSEDSAWEPLIDGSHYLAALADTLDGLVAGDALIVVGLELDPAVDLRGRRPGDTGYCSLGETLADTAARGVDVRIVLASRVWASSIPGSTVGAFRTTAADAEVLRNWRVGDRRPLAGRVLLDYSGSLLGSNHQKAVVVRADGHLVGYVGGIDLVSHRFDGPPHDTQRLHGRRWGWHDAAVRVRGRAAEQVWADLRARWIEASTLPPKTWRRSAAIFALLNPERPAGDPGPAGETAPVATAGVSVRVLRSVPRNKIESLLPWRVRPWAQQPATGVQEIFETLAHAIEAAQRYVYVEDQYLAESLGGDPAYELWRYLRRAAARGVRIVLVGSGIRDPDDVGLHLRQINRTLNHDVAAKLVAPLWPAARRNVALYRLEHLTVHSKIVLIDDRFACIGSANLFSRSMAGTDIEIAAAVATDGPLIRELRAALWAEHLRTPPVDALADLDVALGVWRTEWATGRDPVLWRAPGHPSGFAPAESVLALVGP